jgi:predicted ABC-type ATPase
VPRPRMIVVAGPPGSGKTRFFPVTAFGIDAFNIDDRCAQILGSYRGIPREVRRAAAQECERFILEHIDLGRSFAVETTLRTIAAIEQADLAVRGGFATEMHFIATDSVAETSRASSSAHRQAVTRLQNVRSAQFTKPVSGIFRGRQARMARRDPGLAQECLRRKR